MLDLEAVPHHYEEAVTLLANWHRDLEDASFTAYSFPDPQGASVRLLEVSDRFPSVDAIRPVRFGQSADFPFPSAVAQVASRDWQRIESGSLPLPEGWHFGDRRHVIV